MNVRRGLTLIELLATVAIVALVAGIGVAALGSASQEADERGLLNALQDLERRARLVAKTIGPAALQLDEEERVLRVVVVEGQEQFGEVQVAEAFDIAIETPDGDLFQAIGWGRDGRCVNHDIVVSRDGAELVRLRVSGLTGHVEVVREGI